MGSFLGRPQRYERDFTYPRDTSARIGRRRSGGRQVARVAAIVGIVLAALVITGGVTVYVILNGLTNPVNFVSLAETVPGTRVNILVMGLDAPLDSHGHAIPDFDIHKAEGSRTDTMMLFSVDPVAKDVAVLSLPRDTRTVIVGREWYGGDKLGHAHAYGGPDMLVATVSKMLDVPIHYYVRINSAGVARIIDLLGGVEIYVEQDMHYSDPNQDLYIDLKKGLQTLDGEHAVEYLRYRPGSDIERIERQQKFVAALADQVFSLGTISKIPALISEISKSVDTNLTPAEMLSYAKLATNADSINLRTGIIPGEVADVMDPNIGVMLSYWVIKDDELESTVESLLWNVDPVANAQIRVEVLNGTTVPGLAGGFADELRRQGYDVVSVADAKTQDYQTTEIIDRCRDEDMLRRLSQAVLRYLPDAELGRAKKAGEGEPMFTVVLGQDYANYVNPPATASTP